jgi:replicative DNA helicase
MLNDLITTRGIPDDIETYIEIISEKADKRKLQDILEKQVDFVSKQEVPIDDIVRSVEGAIFQATRTRENHDFKSMEEITREFSEEVTNPKDQSGIKSGFLSLDNIVPSYNPGEFIIVAARPSMGKTAFSLALATQFAKKSNVAYFSIEMPRKQITERILASETMLKFDIISNPRI